MKYTVELSEVYKTIEHETDGGYFVTECYRHTDIDEERNRWQKEVDRLITAGIHEYDNKVRNRKRADKLIGVANKWRLKYVDEHAKTEQAMRKADGYLKTIKQTADELENYERYLDQNHNHSFLKNLIKKLRNAE